MPASDVVPPHPTNPPMSAILTHDGDPAVRSSSDSVGIYGSSDALGAINRDLSCIPTSSPLPLYKMSPMSTYTWPSPPIPVTSSSSAVRASNNKNNKNSSNDKSTSQHTLNIASITHCLTASDLLNLDNTDLNPTSTSTRLMVTDMKYYGLWSLIVTVVDSKYTDT